MKLQCTWNDKLSFTASEDDHKVEMDTQGPLGSDSAMTPKQLVVAAICGCTGMKAVALSQTKYCSVSAMLSKSTPIFYLVELNGENIGEGRADFK